MSSQWPKLKAATGKFEKRITFENMFKAVALLMVWGLLSFPVTMYFVSKEQSTSSDWLDTISTVLQSLEGNCDAGQENGTQDCSNFDYSLQVATLHVMLNDMNLTLGSMW